MRITHKIDDFLYTLFPSIKEGSREKMIEELEKYYVNPFYYTGKRKPTRFGFSNLKYFAPDIKKKGVKEYYEIIKKKSILEKVPILSEKYSASESEDERLLLFGSAKNFK